MGLIKTNVESRQVSESYRVRTKSGEVQGFPMRCKKGLVNVFLGIPYAKPPVGQLRFKKTEPVDPWNGVKMCTKYRSRCPQKDYFWDTLELRTGKSEDCLYLNVIAPSWKPPPDQQNGFPVMIYIHGGGFLVDSAVKYRYWNIARLLSPLDIIVITIQYRLGYLGYFSTADENCIGNFGLWDQVTALKWVSENIEHFGGDPKNITVAGQSAGAVSADLLSLSPHSRDLFQRLILMGGNAECHWAVSDAKVIADYCLRRARKLGWKGTNNAEMMDYLRGLSDHKFGDSMIGNRVIFDEVRLPLTPVIDGDLLPAPICQLRNETYTKPTIIGVTENEGLLFTAIGGLACGKSDVERGMRLISRATEGSGIDISSIVKRVYNYDEQKVYSKNAIKKAFVMMLDDIVNNYAFAMFTHLMAEKRATVYAFSFEHFNAQSYGVMNMLMPFTAATHCTELNYLFNSNVFVTPYIKTSVDRRVTKVMTTLWSSFVKYGDPNKGTDPNDKYFDFVWEPVTEENEERHLRIGKHTGMLSEFKEGRMKLLREIIGNRIVKFS
ncbi:unnamed protein product [Toxocara canis]|uniref:Carboxylic ester hydrolase n=1 Tax=Toxocara canis TaxID=6265 RepID=A0A183UXM0_TOXCA|nr:unnamed protein product [Toxocara canis]